MLEIRTICENCKKDLPNESKDAMICTFECTYCKDCVENILQNVCPNCTGGFEKRPIRPKNYLDKYPVSDKLVYNPINPKEFKELLLKFKDISPLER